MMCFIVLYNHMKKIVKSCFGENSKMTIFNKKETNKHLIHYYTGLKIFKKWDFVSFVKYCSLKLCIKSIKALEQISSYCVSDGQATLHRTFTSWVQKYSVNIFCDDIEKDISTY